MQIIPNNRRSGRYNNVAKNRNNKKPTDKQVQPRQQSSRHRNDNKRANRIVYPKLKAAK